jgi:hypothetical protein
VLSSGKTFKISKLDHQRICPKADKILVSAQNCLITRRTCFVQDKDAADMFIELARQTQGLPTTSDTLRTLVPERFSRVLRKFSSLKLRVF